MAGVAYMLDLSSEAVKCRERAAVCRAKAEKSAASLRDNLLTMAGSWDLLAMRYEQLAASGAFSLAGDLIEPTEPG
jgi:hypothetical protein